MSIDLEKEREAFEKKQAERYFRHENVLRKSEEGAYVSDFIHSAFQGWLERAELAQAEINILSAKIKSLEEMLKEK